VNISITKDFIDRSEIKNAESYCVLQITIQVIHKEFS